MELRNGFPQEGESQADQKDRQLSKPCRGGRATKMSAELWLQFHSQIQNLSGYVYNITKRPLG